MIDRKESSEAERCRAAAGVPRGRVMDLSVVIPVYNECESLDVLDEEVRRCLRSCQIKSEIVYVDDGSTDSSGEALARIVRDSGGGIETCILTLRRNYGQTAALAAGFSQARGAVVVPLDADGQNNPADIPRLLEKLGQGFDVVSGWRKDRKDAAVSRRFPSMVANYLIGALSGVNLHDYGCTMKAYRRELLRELRLYGEMHRFIPVYLHRLGARVTELEVDHRPRKHGVSKYGADRIVRVLLDLVMIRFMSKYFTRPIHFFGKTGLWFLGASGAVGVLMVAFKFGWLRVIGSSYRASFVQTPLPGLAASLLVGGVMSIFMGLLAEILVRVLHESQGLEVYTVAEILRSGQE